MRRLVRPLWRPALALACLAVVVYIDRHGLATAPYGEFRASAGLFHAGVFDEIAHLATAVVMVAALVPRGGPRAFVVVALAASVLIDVDHVPQAYGVQTLALQEGGRPVTHSLLTVALLSAGALVARRGPRWVLAGAAVGVLMHFVRDLGTGGGVPLAWPLSPHGYAPDHRSYLVLLAGCVGVAAVRALVEAVRPSRVVVGTSPRPVRAPVRVPPR